MAIIGRILLGKALHDGDLRGALTGRKGSVQIVPQQECHQTEALLPSRVPRELGRALRLNVEAQLPGDGYSELAWEPLGPQGNSQRYVVWTWRRTDGRPAIPEGRLLRLAMIDNGWQCIVQPRASQVNVYVLTLARGFFSYTFSRAGILSQLPLILRRFELPKGRRLQVIEPGESALSLPWYGDEVCSTARPLAVEVWAALKTWRRVVLVPGMHKLFIARLSGPVLVATAVLVGAWAGEIVRDVKATRELPTLQKEWDALKSRGDLLRQRIDALAARISEWESLRAEIEREPPLGRLVLAVAPALGQEGRIHRIEIVDGVARISGLVTDATAVLSAVESARGFSGARFSSGLSRDPRTGLERFDIEARWRAAPPREEGGS